MLSNKTIEMCKEKLPAHLISQREQRGIKLDYVEGHSMITRMNQVFGYGSWDMQIIELVPLTEEKNQNGNIIIGYRCRVKVTIKDESGKELISREDTGFGSGIAKRLFDAHEGAGKEAVTDAFKRAVRTFGDSFGLALYDKEKKGVDFSDTEQEALHALNEKFGKPKVQEINYKHQIVNLMEQLGVAKSDIPKVAEFIIKQGLDISTNAKDVYLNHIDKLTELIRQRVSS